MRIGIEEFRRRLTDFIESSVYVEVERRGKVVMVLMPLSQYEPTGSEPKSGGLVANHVVEPTGSQKDIQNQSVASRLELARQALAQANSTVGADPAISGSDCSEEVRTWTEDGLEYKVTKAQMQAKFGKLWQVFWKKAAA